MEEKGITPYVVDIAEALLLTIKLPIALVRIVAASPPLKKKVD